MAKIKQYARYKTSELQWDYKVTANKNSGNDNKKGIGKNIKHYVGSEACDLACNFVVTDNKIKWYFNQRVLVDMH